MKSRNTGRAGDGVRLLGTRNGRKHWQARLYWIDPSTGKEREKRVTFAAESKHQAMARRAELLEQARTGVAARTERTRWQTVSDAWFATVTVRATRHSWGSHRRALDRVFGEHWIDAVTARELQDHIDAMPRSPGYANSRRDVASHILDHAIRLGAATRNVAKDVRKRSTRTTASELDDAPQKALTADDARRVIADASAQVLRNVVGHTSEQVHARYQHSHSADVISLAEALGQKLGVPSPRKHTPPQKSTKTRRK